MKKRLVAATRLLDKRVYEARPSTNGAESFDYLEGASASQLHYDTSRNIYHEAKSVVDHVARQLEHILELSRHPDLQPGFQAFLFSLQFKIALEELPLLWTLLHSTSEYDQVEFWDSLIPSEWVKATHPESRSIEFRFSDRNPDSHEPLQKDHDGPLPPQKSVSESWQKLPLLIVGSEVDVSLGIRYLESTCDVGECSVLLKRNDESLVSGLLARMPSLRINCVYKLHELSAKPTDSLQSLLDRAKTLNGKDADLVAPFLPQLTRSIRTALSVEGLIRPLQPDLIFGTLEKSPLGVVLSCLKKHYGYRLVSYQHGLLGWTQTMERLNFDLFFVWTEPYRELLLKDGYEPSDSIRVCDLREERTRDPKFQRLLHRKRSWAPKGYRAVFFEQPFQKSPYSMQDYRTILKTLSGLAARYDFSVVVKPHPKTYKDHRYEEAQQGLARVTRLDTKVSLDEVLQECDLAIGMTSTALLDFMGVGKPAISYDFKHWGRMAGLLDDLFTHTAFNEVQLTELIARQKKWARSRRMLDSVQRRIGVRHRNG